MSSPNPCMTGSAAVAVEEKDSMMMR